MGRAVVIPEARVSVERFQVLLSTFNGAPFLEPLLESVLAQDYPAFSILVRDDSSTDATPSILARYARDPRVSYYVGEHVGIAASFFELLARADGAARFFAFCDQDDVWLPDKLTRSVARLRQLPPDQPVLYCGRQLVVGPTLTRLGLSRIPRRGPSFHNALVENIAAGCTIVVNDLARAVLTRRRPRGVAHDWWSYLVVSAFGRAVYDEQPTILYRQHGANVVGGHPSSWNKWRRRIGRLRNGRDRVIPAEPMLEFRRLFGGELDAQKARVLQRFIDHRRSWWTALAYAVSPDVFRQGRLDDVILRLLIAVRYV